MNSLIRLAIVAVFFAICGLGIIVNHSYDDPANGPALSNVYTLVEHQLAEFGAADFENAYQYAGSNKQKFTFNEFKSVIRHDHASIFHHQRIEFGSVKVEGATASVQALFFTADGRIHPFLCKLVTDNRSWKIESVQRIWFVPRATLLRGLRV